MSARASGAAANTAIATARPAERMVEVRYTPLWVAPISHTFLTHSFAECETVFREVENGRRQESRRRRYRGELDQGRAAQGVAQEASDDPMGMGAAAPPDDHRRSRH